jgi:hypothetical protein
MGPGPEQRIDSRDCRDLEPFPLGLAGNLNDGWPGRFACRVFFVTAAGIELRPAGRPIQRELPFS